MKGKSPYFVTIKEEGKKSVDKKLPYTVIGGAAIPEPTWSILLTAKGIKELAKLTKKDDFVEIKEWSDYTDECKKASHYGQITIIRRGDSK